MGERGEKDERGRKGRREIKENVNVRTVGRQQNHHQNQSTVVSDYNYLIYISTHCTRP